MSDKKERGIVIGHVGLGKIGVTEIFQDLPHENAPFVIVTTGEESKTISRSVIKDNPPIALVNETLIMADGKQSRRERRKAERKNKK
jgi:hypothetical protein